MTTIVALRIGVVDRRTGSQPQPGRLALACQDDRCDAKLAAGGHQAQVRVVPTSR